VVLDAEETSGNGGHEHNTTILLNVLVCCLTNEELCPSVQVENVVELLLCDVLCCVPALGTTVAHDKVDLAESSLGLLEQAVDLANLGDIGLDGDGLGAVVEGLDGVADLIGGGLGVGVVDNDGASTASELDGTATADTTAGTGDEGDLVVEGGGGNGDDGLGHCGGGCEVGFGKDLGDSVDWKVRISFDVR